jgi:predicted metallo-beta-lactamase superfamily hydrolase
MPTSALMTTLMALVENYIKDIVTEQVTAILTNHHTLRFMDDGFKDQIREIAKDVAEQAVSDHCDQEYHISEDEVTDAATSAVEDHDFDSKISDAVNDAINEFDFSDVITASIKDNITFTATISVD